MSEANDHNQQPTGAGLTPAPILDGETRNAVGGHLNRARQKLGRLADGLHAGRMPTRGEVDEILSALKAAHKALTQRPEPTPEAKAEDAGRRREVERVRLAVLAAYGSRCVCCGESHPGALTVQYAGAPPHKRKHGGALYRWLHAEGCPPGLAAVWCLNCSQLKGGGPKCPHQG